MMLQVRKELCRGCGLCAQSCPRGAISLPRGWAEIDQKRCNSCGVCLNICPRGAIVESIPVSAAVLRTTIVELESQLDDIIHRVEKLRATSGSP